VFIAKLFGLVMTLLKQQGEQLILLISKLLESYYFLCHLY